MHLERPAGALGRQSVTTNVIEVPAGPWLGAKFRPSAPAGGAVKASKPRMTAGSNQLARFVIDFMDSPPFGGQHGWGEVGEDRQCPMRIS